MHLENLIAHLRWLKGDTKEPNIIKLDKETIENTIKELEDYRFKIDKLKSCLIGIDIYLDTEDKCRKMLASSIQNTLRGLK